ncbi:unnamed protein product [Rhizoctonia solani]|uniref:Uncharacterized protein n=1 Tax=Rhizoctonia solani TaxID=456999 RepID=A0A8H3B567_9AGAM|nr:unnamed protein product [Rhizoctonia solani]
MPAATTYKNLPMTNRSTVRSLTADFQHAMRKNRIIAKKCALNGDDNLRRSFHGRRASNVRAVQRLTADRLARNSGRSPSH